MRKLGPQFLSFAKLAALGFSNIAKTLVKLKVPSFGTPPATYRAPPLPAVQSTKGKTMKAFEEMTPAELRAEMKARGMQVSHSVTSAKTGKTSRNFYNRKEMIALLNGAPLPAAPVPAVSAPAPVVVPSSPAPAVVVVIPPASAAGTSGAPAPAPATENRTPAAEPAAAPAPAPAVDKAKLARIADGWRKFLSEFQFTPQARFLNSVAAFAKPAEAKEYVKSTFALVNSPYAADVAAKLDSAEARNLLKETVSVPISKRINKRLAIWYGEPGSGKTSTAILENPEAEVVICNAGTTPDELFRGFTFEDGKPAFRPCALRSAMENGKTVILDEINLLSTECLRALQTVTDGKDAVNINGERIEVRDGFRVVGTMNLNVGDQVFPLPPPLVDRAAELRKFELSAEKLAEIAFV